LRSAFDLATKLDELASLGSDGSAAIALEPALVSILEWWTEFSRHLLQTDAVTSEQSDADISTDAGDEGVLDTLVHYLRAVHLVDFYTGKTGHSVLDLCRTVGARPPCRHSPPEQQPQLATVLVKAKALLHTHRQHLNALTASRDFSQTPDSEGATLSNFLQDWERLYPEVCLRAQPPPPSALAPSSCATPSPRFAGRGVAVGQTFSVHSPQALAAFISRNANMNGRSPRKLGPLRLCVCKALSAFTHPAFRSACHFGAARSIAGGRNIRGLSGQQLRSGHCPWQTGDGHVLPLVLNLILRTFIGEVSKNKTKTSPHQLSACA
jgi:hypothetical protein